MTEQEQINDLEVIDLREKLQVLFKWKWVIVLITAAAVAAGAVWSFFIAKPVYEAKVMLLVTMSSDKQAAAKSTDDLESLINSVSRIPQLTMNTYVNQLKSEILLQRVADKLSLDPGVYSPGVLSSIITATAVKDSNLIDIRVQHNDPAMSSKIANTLSEQYLALISEKNQTQMNRSVGFLDTQRQNVEKELAAVTQSLEAFESQPGGVPFLEQQFTSKNEDLSKYQSMLNETKVNLSQAGAGLEETKKQLAAAKPDSPDYARLSQELAARETAVKEQQARLSAVEGVIAQIRQELNAIQSDLARKKAKKENLEAEKKRLEDARNLLAQKVTETQIAGSIDLGETSIMVVSPAMVPSVPVKPDKVKNTAMAFGLGLVLSIFVAFLLEYLDNTVRSPEDVGARLNATLLGAVPVTGNGKNGKGGPDGAGKGLIADTDPRSSAAEAFRGIRTNVGFASVDRPSSVILVTSPAPEDGKSMVAANLAAVMARAGRKVLLVDADLRRPTLDHILGIDNGNGLVNLLARGEDLSGVVRQGPVEGLSLLTSGPVPPNPSELLASNKMAEFLSSARESYDTVILDSPPVLAVTDPLILASRSDGVVMVVKSGIRTEPAAHALEQLDNTGARLLGVVLNMVKAGKKGYGYYYDYQSAQAGG
ncbi:MAG: polysaccharide biosynthesis tyrosine autokinase [Bacillota bacterium]